MNLIDKAIFFAKQKHINQLDDSGMSYFEAHVYQVFNILKQITSNEKILIIGLLHDTIEDTKTTYQELVQEFGKDIADGVMEVTEDGKKDEYGKFFPRLKSRDCILVKFADRLSNLSRMDSWDDKRKTQYLKKSKFWKTDQTNEGIYLATRLMKHIEKTEGSCKCKGYHPNCVNCQHQLFLGALDNYLDFCHWQKKMEAEK